MFNAYLLTEVKDAIRTYLRRNPNKPNKDTIATAFSTSYQAVWYIYQKIIEKNILEITSIYDLPG